MNRCLACFCFALACLFGEAKAQEWIMTPVDPGGGHFYNYVLTEEPDGTTTWTELDKFEIRNFEEYAERLTERMETSDGPVGWQLYRFYGPENPNIESDDDFPQGFQDPSDWYSDAPVISDAVRIQLNNIAGPLAAGQITLYEEYVRLAESAWSVCRLESEPAYCMGLKQMKWCSGLPPMHQNACGQAFRAVRRAFSRAQEIAR
jgi:hypothetical protein